jgi:ketosteroid isomerase-like protein
VRWIAESVTAVGARVVASAITTGRPHGDPTQLEVRLGLLYSVRDGRVTRIEVYLTPESALAAAT